MALLAAAALAATIDVVYDEVLTRKPAPPRRLPRLRRLRDRERHAPHGLARRRPLEPRGERDPRDHRLRLLRRDPRERAPRPCRGADHPSSPSSFSPSSPSDGPPSRPRRSASSRSASGPRSRRTAVRRGSSLVDSPFALASAPLQAVAAIQAPAGLAEGIRHVWSVDGRTVLQEQVSGSPEGDRGASAPVRAPSCRDCGPASASASRSRRPTAS